MHRHQLLIMILNHILIPNLWSDSRIEVELSTFIDVEINVLNRHIDIGPSWNDYRLYALTNTVMRMYRTLDKFHLLVCEYGRWRIDSEIKTQLINWASRSIYGHGQFLQTTSIINWLLNTVTWVEGKRGRCAVPLCLLFEWLISFYSSLSCNECSQFLEEKSFHRMNLKK